jgi:UDP:flavonoid glycosyltransferase YjiC (YdhE family)
MSRILLTPLGSTGDVNPFIWIGRLLAEQGHDVTVVANPHFAPSIVASGLRMAPAGTEEEYDELAKNPEIWQSEKGSLQVMRYAGEFVERHFEVIKEEIERGEKPLVIAPAPAFAARLAREVFGVRLVTVNLQPTAFFSVRDTSIFSRNLAFVRHLPTFIKRIVFRIASGRMEEAFGDGIARACRHQNVEPPHSVFREWWQSPDGAICLFPEWFCKPQPDWLGNQKCVGFPLEDLGRQHGVDAALESFLDAGTPPVLFTAGSANIHAHAFFAAASEACRKQGLRAIFATKSGAQLPADLPAEQRHFSYIPFGSVLPRCTAIVHHGGIGTTSQALATGTPQLIMPMAHDQPDNAQRVARLGAGSYLWPSDFNASNLAKALAKITGDTVMRSRCAEIKSLIDRGETARKLLTVLSPHLGKITS